MTHLSPTLSDPLSQFQEFNWSINLLAEPDPPSTTKTVGSSALQSLTYSGNEPVALSPISSQCYSNQSSLSTDSSTDSSARVGGSAQLRNLASGVPHERPTEVGADVEPRRSKGLSELGGPLAHPTMPDSVQQTLLRSSPRVFTRHRNSTTSELSLPSSLPAPSSNALSRPATTRANSSIVTSQDHQIQPLPRSPTTLWMGDLESWMDEDYVRGCLAMTGLNLPHFVTTSPSGVKTNVGPNGVNVKIKMISGASPSSAYCFLTYPTADMAEQAWRLINSMPPTLMPRCERTFKLNWATGLPGVQPTWDREFSVFIRDLDRDVTEGELVSLFTCSFPSTKSAKIMGDLSTGLSRGYAFIRFGEEIDMHRALALGRSKTGPGLFLRGRRIKIAEASGSSGTAGDHSHHRASIANPGGQKPRHDASSATSMANRPDDHAETRFKSHTISNARTMVNSLSSDDTKKSLCTNRDGMCQPVAGGLSSSTSNLRSSFSYPPPTVGVTHSRNSIAGDSLNANYRVNHDALSQSVNSIGRLSSSMSSLRLANSYPSHSTAPKSAQIHLVPANPTSYPRAIPSCAPFMDRNQSIPSQALPTHYPHPFSHPACTLTPQGVLPSAQAQFTPHGALFPSIGQSVPHPPMPSHFPSSGGLFLSGTEANLNQLNQSYQRLHRPLDGSPPATTTMVSPNSINTQLAALSQIASVANDASNDPSNTTVFVGGLPACISEATLKTFFENFGDITYVKIPPNKGCGFVQYARREDAQQAMLKMHEFPIHGKSRIRLSWGRSLGDKQVEHVKKLASALNISFECVWKIVQGQDPSMIKQIASKLSAGIPAASLPSVTPAARNSLPTARESDHRPLPPALQAIPAGPGNFNYIHHLPSGQSIPLSSDQYSPLLSSVGHRGSWQGVLPSSKSAISINAIGDSNYPAGLRGCRATVNPVTRSSLSYPSIPATQGKAMRPFDKTWAFPI